VRIGFAEVAAALLAVLLLVLIVSYAFGGDYGRMGAIFLLKGASPAPQVFADADGDGLPDEWEMLHFGGLDQPGGGDADGDGSDNRAEFAGGSDPFSADSDGDGAADRADPQPLAFDDEGWGYPSLPILEDRLNAAGLVVFHP